MAGMAKRLGEMAFNSGGGVINWFPGHMAAATRAIRERLKLADLVLEVRDARIPLTSANKDLQDMISCKRRLIVLNKKDLANSNIMHKWTPHFHQHKQCCCFVNAHNKTYVKKLLVQVEAQLKEAISKHPTLLVMVVGIPNVGKSALINSMHQIARTRFPAQEKLKRATVGPLPGVTQDIAGFKIAHQPSIYVLDTPGVLVPNIPDIETGLKLALTGAIKDSVVGEDRLAQYLLAMLNTRGAPLHWKDLDNEDIGEAAHFCPEDPVGDTSEVSIEEKRKPKKQRQNIADHTQVEGLGNVTTTIQLHNDHAVLEVRRALFRTLSAFEGNLENEDDLESLIEIQFSALQKAFKILPNSGEAGHNKVARKILNLFRIGKLGHYTLDVAS